MNDFLSPSWVQYIFGFLFTAAWQAAVLVALSLAASLCTRRAIVRSTIWTVCVIALALAPLVSVLLPHCFVAYGGHSEPLHFPTMLLPSLSGKDKMDGDVSLQRSRSDAVRQVLVCAWLAGAVIALARLGHGWFGMLRLLRFARPCHDPRVLRVLERMGDRPDSLSVLEMKGLVGAVCWQVHRPKIILPADTHRLNDLELEMILRHELGHLSRGDPGMLFLERLVEIVYWFHPLVWWVTLQTSKYREFVCDEFVLAGGYDPSDYAGCLGQLAVWYYAPLPVAPAGLGIVWSQHLVLARVRRLLRNDGATGDLTRAELGAIGSLACTAILIASLVRVDWPSASLGGRVWWTAWPHWSAGLLDTAGIQVRDFPLDAHRYDPQERLEESHSRS